MEHITIIDIDETYVKLVPDEGYKLYNTKLNIYVSEAIIKREHLNDYIAIIIAVKA